MIKSQSPLVSCILPVYNRKELLRNSLYSIVNQTYTNIEIIVVDDGSSEPVDLVIEEFDDKRIKLITHSENRGGGAARNTGIKHSNGDYIAFLDSDDWWLPSKLQRQVSVMNQADEGVGVVGCGGFKTWKETGIIRGKIFINHHNQSNKYNSEKAKKKLLSGSSIVTTSKILVKKECLDNVGYFDEGLPSMQEHDLNVRLAEKYDFVVLQNKLVIKDESVSNRISHDYQSRRDGLDIFLNKHSSKMVDLFGPTSVDEFKRSRIDFIYQLRTVEEIIDKRYMCALNSLQKWWKVNNGLEVRHILLLLLVILYGDKGNAMANKLRFYYLTIME